MDFDPRWNDDPRDDNRRDDSRREESGRELNQGSRGVSSDPLERDARDPRDVFTRDLDLPRGPNRERVWFREHSVLLRGSESRALATTGAFRVVHADDLRDSRGQAYDPRSGELRHLREQKLVRTIPIRDGRALVVLTERGRDVLERNRHEREQHFYSGLQRPRELLHDAKVYQAYEREAERLREDGAIIHRVMLDTELKREYQQFLQEHNRGKSDSDGRPDRSPDEIARWAMDHDLPGEGWSRPVPRRAHRLRGPRRPRTDARHRGGDPKLPRRARVREGVIRIQSPQRRRHAGRRLTWGRRRRQPARQRRLRLHRKHR